MGQVEGQLADAGPRAEDEASEAEFFAAWEAFVTATQQARYRVNAEGRGPLTFSQYHLVKALAEKPLPSMEVAAAAGVTGATSTRMLDDLERRGIVSRSASKKDGRVVMVRLTAAGRRSVAQMREIVDAKRRAVHAGLDPEERRVAARILRRLAEGVRSTDP